MGPSFCGRDHHPRAFTVWMAGGGTVAGTAVGATDDLGYSLTEDPVHVHDLDATVLDPMALDHTELTYRHQRRAFRLTDTSGKVVRELQA